MTGRLRRWFLPLVCLAGAGAFLLPVVVRPTGAPFWRGADYTDLLIAHLPSAIFLHHAVRTWSEIPLWNPTILSGQPFAADPLSGLWYPPLWLAAVFPFPVTFNLLTLVHLAWAGVGMGLFLRRIGLSPTPAAIGALAFAGTPKLVGHFALGHISLVYAVSWMPWLLLSTETLADTLSAKAAEYARRAATAGAILGVIFLIDPRWAGPAGFLAVLYGLARWLSAAERGRHWGFSALMAGGVALGVSAGLGLPLLEWLPLTTRPDSVASAGAMSLPPTHLLGLLAPQYGGWPEWMVSLGIVVVILAAVALSARMRGTVFWVAVAVLGWLLALGDATPVGTLASWLPGFDLLRVPARWLFLAALAVAVLSAVGAEAILAPSRRPEADKRLRIGTFVAAVAFVAVSLGVSLVEPTGPSTWRMAGGGAAVLAFVLVLLRSRLSPRLAASLWIALVVVDLAVFDASLLTVRCKDAIRECSRLPSELATGGRVFSPSYAISQTTAADAGIELADGVHPLQLRAYVEWMAAATGFEAADYSVTLPPFPSGDPKDDWRPTIDADALGRLSVDRIVSDYPISSEGLRGPQNVGGLHVYFNPAARPRAWVEAPGAEDWRAVGEVMRSPNHIVVEAEGPGRLVLSEVAYPGWSVEIDGALAELEVDDGLLRAVDLPEGEHVVRFDFRPVRMYVGLSITLVTLGVLAFLWSRKP